MASQFVVDLHALFPTKADSSHSYVEEKQFLLKEVEKILSETSQKGEEKLSRPDKKNRIAGN